MARLEADDVAGGSHYADMYVDWSMHADVCARGHAWWVGSTGIRVGSTHPGEEDAWHAWGASVRVGRRLAGECGHVRRPILTPFSPVALYRPPLHSGMVKTPF